MATRSLIAVQREENKYDAVYCHLDGYPSGVGQTLKQSYTNLEKVNLLIEGGAMSSLHDDIEKCDYYTKYGESLKIYKNLNLNELIDKAKAVWCEYIYVIKNVNNEFKWETISC